MGEVPNFIMTVKTTNFVAPCYGKSLDHLEVGLDNNVVASRAYVKHFAPGTYVINYAHKTNDDWYYFNIGIATGEYDKQATCSEIWPNYEKTRAEGRYFIKLVLEVRKLQKVIKS